MILFKKLLRTMKKYKAQFISMILMVTIGVGILVGFNMEWYSLEVDTSKFMQETKYADYRIMNTLGFSSEDCLSIVSIDGIDAASRILNVNVNVKEDENNSSLKDDSLALFVNENYTVSTLDVQKGEEYDSSKEGFYLSDKYAKANNISVNDELTLSYQNMEISGKVISLVKSSEFMICVADSNQVMPDYKTYGFVYITPYMMAKALGITEIPYYQINILSDLEKDVIEEKISEKLNKTTLVLSKDEHTGYAAAKSEIEEGQTMVKILPILFLLIAILTMVTTMHRVTSNEKIQIGTLKALGFKDKKILIHYTLYGLFIGIVGSILGLIFGVLIAKIIINPYIMQGTYFDLNTWGIYSPWWTYILLIGIVLFLTLISFLSVKKMLKGTAADALRPYVPKKVKPLKMERTRLWNKFHFATKWNLRDLLRHKTRFLVTVIGILSCMVLMSAGLGMRDTLDSFMGKLENVTMNYTTKINFSENAENDECIAYLENYEGDYSSSSSVQVEGETLNLEIYNISHDYIKFTSKNNKEVPLIDDGVYICVRIQKMGYNVGDTIKFSPYGSNDSYEVPVKGIIRSNLSKNITMSTDYAESINLSYQITNGYVDIEENKLDTSKQFISSTQSKTNIMKSYDNMMEIMNTSVAILIVAAIILSVVVLYNLGTLGYIERYKELSTLKVVGFNDKKIGKILISQNIWLTILGIILGLPLGIGVLQVLLDSLAAEYELTVALGPATFIISILVTFVVSLIVSLIVANKNKKIDMVESLKGLD